MTGRVEIPVDEISAMDTKKQLTGVAVDTSNYHYIDASGDTQGLLLIAENTDAGTDGTIQFQSGDNPPAFEAGLGDSSLITCTKAKITVFSLTSARFAQSDGKVEVDVPTFAAGNLYAVRLPKAGR